MKIKESRAIGKSKKIHEIEKKNEKIEIIRKIKKYPEKSSKNREICNGFFTKTIK